MKSTVARADGFYKFLTLVGLIVGISGAGLALWNVQSGQKGIFALEADVAALNSEAARLETRVAHVETYLTQISRKKNGEFNRASSRYHFLAEEVHRTSKRIEQGRLEIRGKTDVASTKSAQIAFLKHQRTQDFRLGGIVAGSGLVITMIGLIFWYWRVQRYVEIETQARMTTHLVEEIVARSRTEVIRARGAAPEGLDDVAVVSDMRQARQTS